MTMPARAIDFIAHNSPRRSAVSVPGPAEIDPSSSTPLRATRARGAVITALQQANGHLDAMRLWSQARVVDPRISLASVYRTLNTLLEQGIVRKYLFKGGRAVWEIAGSDPHGHLIDVATGDVLDIIDTGLRQQLERSARALGYRVIDINIELYGRPIEEGVPTNQRKR